VAASAGWAEMIAMCIDDGADSAALAGALDIAAHAGQHRALGQLLQAGAPVDPALLHAARRGDTEAVELIHAGLSARLLVSGALLSRLI
jgi:hypothetical protein